MLRPDSARCCSTQVSGSASAGPRPCRRRDEFGDEGAGHRRLRARHVGDHQNQVLRIILGGCRHPVRPIPGQIALVPAGGDARPDPPQILDHRQAQHDRDRPQLAQPEIGDGLIGRHEAIERFRIDPPVAMRDGFQRNVVDTGMPGRRPGGQTGQFAAVAFGQMPLGGADLFLDQVEVVEQPLAGRGDPALFGGYRGQLPADTDQRVFVGRQPIQQAVRDASRSQPVRCRQRPAVLGHLAIAVARREVHPAINAAGILEQGLLDDTLGLDKFLPIHRTEDTQAADAVADRHLVGGLRLVLGLNQLRDAQTGFRQVLLDPGQRQRQRRPPPLQATDEFGDEGAGHRRLRARHVGDHQNQVLRIILGGMPSSGPPNTRPDCARPSQRRCAPRPAADSRSPPGAA